MRRRETITLAVIVVALGYSASMTVGANVGGTVVTGQVIGKREAIEMPLADTWRHVFEISYRYQPDDQPYPAIGRHPVDQALYEQLHGEGCTLVRYWRVSLIGVPITSPDTTSSTRRFC
jgi:hypothetical protein